MLAVDSTLKFVGPATAGGQFGVGTAGPAVASVSTAQPFTLHFPG